MKKLTIFVSALTLTTSMFAQDLTSKKGENYLPETGDWAIGIDANPFLNYFGNFIGGNGDGNDNVAPSFNFQNANQTIIGKYFVSEKMAYRGALRIGMVSNKQVNVVDNRNDDNGVVLYPNIPATVENTGKFSRTNIGLTGGLEWRKGTTRLQGFYGGEFGIMLGGTKGKYEYGNQLNQNLAPGFNVDVDAVDGFDQDGIAGDENMMNDTYNNPARALESKTSMFGLGVRGFIGVEYFVLPKLSVGGEFGWGLVMMSNKATFTTESEGIVNGNETKGEQTPEAGKTSSFGIDTDNNNTLFGNAAQLRIVFHF